MMLRVADIVGVEGVPTTNFGVRKWLKRLEVPIIEKANYFVFHLSNLPDPVRRAFVESRIDADGLRAGTYDDHAHAALAEAPATMRAEAERKAAIARALVAAGTALTWTERVRLVQGRFGGKGVSKASLKRIYDRVNGVDPINYAPVLLAGHEGGAPRAEMTPEAWSLFRSIIRRASPDFPMLQAWRDLRDLAKVNGWQWPSYPTVMRRWNTLSDAQKLTARHGRDEALKALAQPIHRDKTTIGALEWVSLDGHDWDFWTRLQDGSTVRLTLLALVDVASNKVLDYQLARSENAVDTVQLIKRVCQKYGVFDKLYTDNGSAFAGHLVAGGNIHRFRNSRMKSASLPIPGICQQLGITLKFALPANAKAKIAERTFASLSRVIANRPEFDGAHAGHGPGQATGSPEGAVSLNVAETIIRREVDRYNAETGRRSQGARGRSYDQVFADSLADRICIKPTRQQLYLAGLIYTPCSVDRHGQVKVDNWVYGSPLTQEALLPYHGKGRQILLGRDPDDFTAPALAYSENGRLICRDIEYVARSPYASKAGIREAARNRKLAREAVAQAEAANNYLNDAELTAALDGLNQPEDMPPAQDQTVVGGYFGSPLAAQKQPRPRPAKAETVPADFLKNLDNALAKGGKLA